LNSLLEDMRLKDLELGELKTIIKEQKTLIKTQTKELRKITNFYQDLEDVNIALKDNLEKCEIERDKYKQMSIEFNEILSGLMKNYTIKDRINNYEARIIEINKKIGNIKNENDIINSKIDFMNTKNQKLNDLIVLKNEQIKDMVNLLLPLELGNTETITENLEIISKLQEGDTISSSSRSILAHNEWYTTIYRSCNKETRLSTFKWIKNVFYDALNIVIKTNEKEKTIPLILSAVSKLPELVKTYKADTFICCKIEKLMFKIKLILQICEFL